MTLFPLDRTEEDTQKKTMEFFFLKMWSDSALRLFIFDALPVRPDIAKKETDVLFFLILIIWPKHCTPTLNNLENLSYTPPPPPSLPPQKKKIKNKK